MRSVLVLVSSLCCGLCAQDLVSHGELNGTVLDPSGRAVQSVRITLDDLSRDLEFNAESDLNGRFRFPLLPPSVYRLTAESSGLATLVQNGIEVRVGDRVGVICEMGPAISTRIRIEVTAPAPAIDYQRTSQASFLEMQRLDQLPINRRNYLDFTLLSPGVVDTAGTADQATFRVPTTPDSALGFSGGNGRGNLFSVDGFSNNGTTGNFRPSLPLNAVQEFQVQRLNYSAELGGGYGGAINVISRSGTNDFHGSVFAFLRNSLFQARNFFDPGKSAYTRAQSGAALGGPLRKERTFFFGSFERLDRHEATFVPILQNKAALSLLKPSQAAVIGFLEGSSNPKYAAVGASLPGLLTPSNNPLVTSLFNANSGVFPFSAGITQASVRLDHRFSAKDTLLVRVSLTDDSEQNTHFGALIGLSRGSSTYMPDRTAGVQYTRILSPQWTWLTRASVSYSRLLFNPNNATGPAIDINGFGSFGRDPQFPSDARYRIGQLQQSASWTGAHHSWKFGGEYFPANSTGRLETFFGGQFIFGEYIPLGLILNGFAGDPSFSTALGSAMVAAGKSALVSGLNDPINSLQAYSLGLPVAYIQGFGNPYSSGTQQRAAFFVEDTYRPLTTLVLNYGLRYQFDSFSSVPTMKTWAPRLDFAWSPRFSDKLVIRGGFGIFHSLTESFITFSATAFRRDDLNVLFVPLSGVPGVNNPATGLPVTSADIYQSLLARGILGARPIAYGDLTPLGVNPALRFPTTGGVAPDYRNPYAEQASLEIEREFGSSSISVGWNFSRVLRLPRTRDRNLKQVGTNPNGTPVFGLVDPAVLHNYVLESTAKSFYSGMVVQVNRTLRNHVAVQAYYTLSRTTDEVTDFNIDYAPDNQLNARADRGLSAFHEKHRFVTNAVLESPYTRKEGATGRLLSDWAFSPIVSAHSFRPFNILTGYDTLGDGQANTHRPFGAGRNIGRGPNFFSVDTRLTRTVSISPGGRAKLMILAEAFNLLNRTNFLTVNNIVGTLPLSALPHALTGSRGDPTQPLSFTSASDARQFQFGLKVEF